MRRFEFVEGSSSKFWEVWCEGATLHTRYGRLGASGQTTLKSFGSDAAAKKAEDALIRQKTGKGYVEKSGGDSPSPQPLSRKESGTTPFLQRLAKDPKLEKALRDTELGPAEGSDWAEAEKEQHRVKQFRLGDEWSPIKFQLDFLADFPETEILELGITDKIDLSPLRALTRLKLLKLSGATKQFIDLSFLAGMKKLEELDIRGPRVKSLDPVAASSALTKLGVTHGEIDDLSPLTKLKSLRQIFLPNQKLTSLAPLEGKTGLTYLQVPKNQISDVRPLAKLTVLRFLGLKENAVRDVSPLAGLVALDTMYLEGNPVTNTSMLRGLKNLKTKDFKIQAGAAPKVSEAVKKRLAGLAVTKECTALLDKLLGRVNDVSEKKGALTLKFDADDHDVISLEVASPFSGRPSTDLPRSFIDVVTKVGAVVHVDVSRPGVDGPRVGLTKKGAPSCNVEWDGEDRARFHDFCDAGQNWFVFDTQKKNALGEPGIVFFSHEGALDPKRRFPMQDKVKFGVGGFLIRALAFRVFADDKAFGGCGWG